MTNPHLGRLLHDVACRISITGLALQMLTEDPEPSILPGVREPLLALRQEVEAAIDVVHEMQVVVRNADANPYSGSSPPSRPSSEA